MHWDSFRRKRATDLQRRLWQQKKENEALDQTLKKVLYEAEMSEIKCSRVTKQKGQEIEGLRERLAALESALQQVRERPKLHSVIRRAERSLEGDACRRVVLK